MIRFFVALILCMSAVALAHADDWRAYHHGIDYVPAGNGTYWIFYSGVANANRDVGDEEEWRNHIYVAPWAATDTKITPHLFINRTGAQEPVSVARSDDGHIMITAEDSGDTEDDVDQRYGVYDPALGPVKPYPQQVATGGHSGHVAAVSNRFVIFYSKDWIDHGGVDDLGSGNGVYAKIYDSNGTFLRAVNIAPHAREWWPLIAGSPTHALLVWQSYVRGQTYARLKAAVLDPATGILIPVPTPDVDLKYYTYSVTYMAALDRFVVAATNNQNHGFAFLVDEQGHVTAALPCMPPTEREAGIAVLGVDAYMPVADQGMMRLHATATSLELTGTLLTHFSWAEEGSIGIPTDSTHMHWVSLDRYGLQEADFAASAAIQPTPQDLCR